MLGKVLSLELTERCNIRCAHCLVGCEPKTGRNMDSAVAIEAIDAAVECGFSLVSVSGGEPLLARRTLRKTLKAAAQKSMAVRLITNASWARTDKKTNTLIEQLVAEGLTHLSISADRYHQEFVPLENVRRLVRAARKQPLHVEINLVLSRDEQTVEILRHVAKWDVAIAITPLARQGRARDLYHKRFFDGHCAVGCQVVKSPGVDVEGSVNICCNLSGKLWRRMHPKWPFRVGHVAQDGVKTALELQDNDFSRCILQWGPMCVADRVAKQLGEPRRFTGPCEACWYLAEDCKRTELAMQLVCEGIDVQDSWDTPLNLAVLDGVYRLADISEIIDFQMSGHLSEEGKETKGFMFTFSRPDKRREFLLLDATSADEISGWLDKKSRGKNIRVEVETNNESIVEEVRRRMLYAQLVDSRAITRIN
ncbi:hypothetical protein MNBD_GAMMA13-1328 [hydrothermal vent metagenome]|uniref:Radical SAM core domain-containing protein n=1 Tax=hydrothermal vent metagenome TaxID=652676 RepID=A0A3B0ZNW1_9ZZZZ